MLLAVSRVLLGTLLTTRWQIMVRMDYFKLKSSRPKISKQIHASSTTNQLKFYLRISP